MAAAESSEKMGAQATWAMSVGGMVGGGIFTVAGLLVALAGPLAWASLLSAGLLALATAHSYVGLSAKYGKGGGSFTFLRRVNLDRLAGTLSWVLLLGYILMISVYAYTFAHYVAAALGVGPLGTGILAAGVVALFVAVNLLGVKGSSTLEIALVWTKLIVLLGLAGVGLVRWNPGNLSTGVPEASAWAVFIGAAAILMAYEGFELITYDYEEIEKPRRTLWRTAPGSVLTVMVVYTLVIVGAASLAGAGALAAAPDTALAVAGQAALGRVGFVAVCAAAAISASSAVNATLFSTARLAKTIADEKELPRVLCHANEEDVPDAAILFLGAASAALAAFGTLSALVEAGSLVFLATFAVVNFLAAWKLKERRWIGGVGGVGCTVAAAALGVRLAQEEPYALAALAGLVLVSVVGRFAVVRRRRARERGSRGRPT